jgi:hypothetical protein
VSSIKKSLLESLAMNNIHDRTCLQIITKQRMPSRTNIDRNNNSGSSEGEKRAERETGSETKITASSKKRAGNRVANGKTATDEKAAEVEPAQSSRR